MVRLGWRNIRGFFKAANSVEEKDWRDATLDHLQLMPLWEFILMMDSFQNFPSVPECGKNMGDLS